MRNLATSTLLLAATAATAVSANSPQLVFTNPAGQHPFDIPTQYESTVQARRIMRLESIGTLSTIFPAKKNSQDNDDMSILENRPQDVAGAPLGLMEYFADCEPSTGNPTMLAVTIANSYRNAADGSNVTLSFRWQPPAAWFDEKPQWTHNPANLPRVAVTGYLERMSKEDIKKADVEKCFTKYHPEARIWSPGNDIHESYWARLVVQEVYWFGGFGDRAWIGWLDPEEWRGVTEKEIESIRLPGEKKKKESSSGGNWWNWLEL